MLKTIAAALLAASVLVVAPAMAHDPGRAAQGFKAHGFEVVHVRPGVWNSHARMGRHHHRFHRHFRHHHRHFHDHYRVHRHR
jgi:hypothetical protein